MSKCIAILKTLFLSIICIYLISENINNVFHPEENILLNNHIKNVHAKL